MESYSSSSSSSLYLSHHDTNMIYPERPSRLFHSALHSVRKPPAKPWKKPVAPPVPVPTRVYKVDRINFREVVQQLTGASSQSRRLQRVAPPPLDLATIPSSIMSLPVPRLTSSLSCNKTSLVPESEDTAKPWMLSDTDTALSLSSPGAATDLGLSPISHMWWSLPLLSPGALSIF